MGAAHAAAGKGLRRRARGCLVRRSPWGGPGAMSWVAERFGVRLAGDASLPELVRLALRRNPRRAHLLVSSVLGKHVPADPRIVHGTGLELGRLVGKALDGRTALVLGFAETATGLGHCVAEALGAE